MQALSRGLTQAYLIPCPRVGAFLAHRLACWAGRTCWALCVSRTACRSSCWWRVWGSHPPPTSQTLPALTLLRCAILLLFTALGARGRPRHNGYYRCPSACTSSVAHCLCHCLCTSEPCGGGYTGGGGRRDAVAPGGGAHVTSPGGLSSRQELRSLVKPPTLPADGGRCNPVATAWSTLHVLGRASAKHIHGCGARAGRMERV
jgi:hypothetical protein